MVESGVVLAVLFAALLHASWNALVKSASDRFLSMTVVNGVHSILMLPLVLLLPLPAAGAWPWLIASILIHQLYYVTLILAYRHGDLSQAYPLARGSAPLLVALGAWFIAGETLSLLAMAALAITVAGIVSLMHGIRFSDRRDRHALTFALATGVAISGYTVADGMGARALEWPLIYIAWLFFLDGLPFPLIAPFLRSRAQLAAFMRRGARSAAIGGAISILAYGIVIWAMSVTAMSSISATRETSVVSTVPPTGRLRFSSGPEGRQCVPQSGIRFPSVGSSTGVRCPSAECSRCCAT